MSMESQLGKIRAVVLAAQEIIEIAEKVNQDKIINDTKKRTYDTVLRLINEEDYCPWKETEVDYEHF